MKHRINILPVAAITLLVLMTASLSSCIERMDGPVVNPSDQRGTAEIFLNLTVQDLLNATARETKAPKVDTLTNDESSDIKNLWIIQFDGTEEDDTLLFYHYYNNYDAIKTEAINVIASGTKDNSLFFIANSFDSTLAFGSAKTIAQARQKTMRVINEGKTVHSELVGDKTVHYPMMNGVVKAPISTGTVSCALERSVARIDCNVKCNVSGMTVQDVTLCSVPGDVYCLTKDYVSTQATFPPAAGMRVIDYEPTPWADGVQKTGDPATRQFSFYVPCNKRGTSSNTNPKLKSAAAPANSTYARVTASFLKDGVTRYATYTFYLGANLTNDFNLLPNHKYTYNFTIDKIGDQDTDYRVAFDYVDFTKRDLANCYMIQPPVKGTWKSYLIPIERVYDFWHDYAGDDLRSLKQTNCPGWEVQIIWSDTPLNIASAEQARGEVANCNFKWIRSCKKYHGNTGDVPIDVLNDYFEFEIPSSMNNASILIGIKRYSDNTCTTLDEGYLWSWHMWITDYVPSKCSSFVPEVNAAGDETRYAYSVPGGEVHRYRGAMWNNNTGQYKGKFIMDRNLGARLVNVFTNYNELYYQFGRKDPFCANRTQYNVAAARTNVVYNATTGANNNVNYSVIWPNAFITSNDWRIEWTNGATTAVTGTTKNYNQVTPTIYWNDPKAGDMATKSIFDPCPEGWRVPFNGTWSDFNNSTLRWGTPIPNGMNYFPEGFTGTIYYSEVYYIYYVNGRLAGNGTGPNGYWSCSPNSYAQGYYFGYSSGGVLPSARNNRASGYPVRCVQE